MSPLPLVHRYALSQTAQAVQPAVVLISNLLDAAHHRDNSQATTVTVTVTKWYPTPQFSEYIPAMSRDAMVPSAAGIPSPTWEAFASPTSSPTGGTSSRTTFNSGLVAGIAAGVLVLAAQAAVWCILWRRRRRRKACAAIRVCNYGCGSESPGESSLRVTPYDVDEAPPSYDALDRKTILAPPEPALVRLGAIQHIMYSPGGEPEEPVAFGRTAPSTWSGTRDQSIGAWSRP